jgi:hypothetical protein
MVLVQGDQCPVCNLRGKSEILQEASFPFIDPGVCFTDTLTGQINYQSVVEGKVDMKVPGTYTLKYKQPSGGQCASACTRTVTVQDTLKPVLWLSYGKTQLHQSKVSDKNPAQYFTDEVTTKKLMTFDSATELGTAPWIPTNGVAGGIQPSNEACQAACQSNFQCNFGTYITSGVRKGECWLSANTGTTHRPCGVPCTSFFALNKTTGSDPASRRLLDHRRVAKPVPVQAALYGAGGLFAIVAMLAVNHMSRRNHVSDVVEI